MRWWFDSPNEFVFLVVQIMLGGTVIRNHLQTLFATLFPREHDQARLHIHLRLRGRGEGKFNSDLVANIQK